MTADFPIDACLPDIVAALQTHGRVVVEAPPGTGKTTRVPGALTDAFNARVVVLEPRRIAARAAAEFVARQRKSRLGEEVGYRVRFDRKGGARTRLWFVTEGVLTRQLAADPFLEDIDILVLDEFHERHIHGDVALAVALELQQTVRPDLKIVVMSATLDSGPISRHLSACPVVRAEARRYPVDIEYLAGAVLGPLPERVAGAMPRALGDSAAGDILVFLPGIGEIRSTADAIAEIARRHDADVVPLHGGLPLEAQRLAIEPGRRRRVVLSTNVAETALTIPGVTVVIDSGLVRGSRYDAKHGINRLEVGRISKASAEQRAGRAGRLGPGRCYRLWSFADHTGRLDRETPEIQRLDLAELTLQTRAWGLATIGSLPWLDPPPPASATRAEQHLVTLGAVSRDGALTDIGRRMVAIAAEPRLARVLIEADRQGIARAGALVAALASERDVRLQRRGPRPRHRTSAAPALPGGSDIGSDLVDCAELFVEAQRSGFRGEVCRRLDVDRRTLLTVDRARKQFLGSLRLTDRPIVLDGEQIRRCLLAGFPDRVVRRREPGSVRGVMVGRTGVSIEPDSVVRGAEFYVAIELDRGGQRQHSEARVRAASAIERTWLPELFPGSIERVAAVEFDEEREAVLTRASTRFVDLVLDEKISSKVDPLEAAEVLARAACQAGTRAVSIGAREESLFSRIGFLKAHLPEARITSATGILADVILEMCRSRRSFAELREIAVAAEVERRLSFEVKRLLAAEAPEAYQLPTGRAVTIHYDEHARPRIRARIQELFGLTHTPRLARGRAPLVIEILAPNQRPVQVTEDLQSFWRNTYADVRKQLRGRYAKHEWPVDPLTAKPTGRAKRRNKPG